MGIKRGDYGTACRDSRGPVQENGTLSPSLVMMFSEHWPKTSSLGSERERIDLSQAQVSKLPFYPNSRAMGFVKFSHISQFSMDVVR